MKATGVVRRIDDLGRIVIPKEIRRNLRIREGDSLEIYTDGSDSIILKKYSHIENINNFIIQYVDAVYASNKKEIIITDTERIIASAGNFRKDIVGKKIDLRLDDRIQKRNTQLIERNEGLEVTENLTINSACVLKPITVYGDLIGSVIVISETDVGDSEKVLAEMTSTFLGKYLES
ncbi:MAG: stage V sporulation T C-terminal domain-containing protein [Bacilli bacterium]|nr:stage V sporulation T C-terminal domain-containing protein [Bacilli bacterium]